MIIRSRQFGVRSRGAGRRVIAYAAVFCSQAALCRGLYLRPRRPGRLLDRLHRRSSEVLTVGLISRRCHGLSTLRSLLRAMRSESVGDRGKPRRE